MNSLMVIHPTKFRGVWAFDDPSVGLRQEPFVMGAGEYIDSLAEGSSSVTCVFSEEPFPGHMSKISKVGTEMGGTWYETADKHRLWLCPALFKYFEKAPSNIYVQVIRH